MKEERQRRIAVILQQRAITSQQELAGILWSLGYDVTQATVSRDLKELGAVKLRRNGSVAYALPAEGEALMDAQAVARLLASSVTSFETSGNLVVMRTPPGHASVVAGALDRWSFEDIAGTIAGDDTLLVICKDGVPARQIERYLRDLVGI